MSYHSDSSADDMTTEQYISDIIEVTHYLRNRFKKEKIYILGHSFGTYAAIKTVQKSPERYYAYIAMSQTCNTKESEYLAYDYMKQQYEKLGNQKMVKQFEVYPIRDSEEIYENYFSSSFRDNAMHDLGIGTTREMKSVISGIFFPSLRCTAYTWQERINIWKGKSFSTQFPVTKDAITFNAFEEVSSLQVPIYFFAGKYDYTCNYPLQKKYYEQIKAPSKDFFTFENSAHSPLFEEPEKARDILQMIVNKTCPSSQNACQLSEN